MELCKNYRLLCNGFEPVGTLRFCDSNSLALSANGEELNGERKALLARGRFNGGRRHNGIRGLAVEMQFPTTVTSNINKFFWKTNLQRTGQSEPTGAPGHYQQ
ncbi:hypothetical protein OIU85_010894 [Salix viminalis]|uniref:Uncharacterized protein n=1 Tax=Salix viminalis TaxID=40686 RepID=A0A9Q0NRQ6_SALVM|nr:hypothetical protein OIU85_010894 [Salix viminalis]